MICPYCNVNMEKGYLLSAHPAFWSERKKKLFFHPDDEGDIAVTKGIWNGSFADAWVCRKCGKMIVDLTIE